MRTQHETQTKTPSDASPTRRLSEYEYLFSNMETTFSSPQTRTRTEQQQLQRQRATQEQAQNGYVPGFEGYISIAFSVHIPFWELTVDDLEQERLESLVMLFLCSQGVEMVLSTDPTTLFPVCPFNDIGNGNGNSNEHKALTRSAAHAVVDGGDPVVVWNLPKMDTLTLPFRAEELVRDMATNTTESVTRAPAAPSSELQQHYTRLNFTYPVYEWGSEDPSVRDELQLAFDTSVVETKTLDGLLPWPNAQTAPIGEEPYVFWDEPLPDAGLVYDTEIPELAGTVLRWIGVGLLALNTLVVLCLSTGARLHVCRLKKSAERRLLLLQTGSHHHHHHPYGRYGGGGHDQQILDTEEGVSAILMESKQYALSKRSSFSAAAMAATTSVPPSPQESSLVALAKQQARERERDPNRPVGMALGGGGNGGGGGGHHSHSQWFAGKEATTNALGDYDEDDEEAENMMADLRILNLSSGEVLVQEAPKGAAAKAKTKPATTNTNTSTKTTTKTTSSVSSSNNGSTENAEDKSGGVETLKSVNLSF